MTEISDSTLLNQLNLYLACLKKRLDTLDSGTLKNMRRAVKSGTAAAPVYIALGAGVKWLKMAMAKEKALDLIIELQEVMKEL